MMSKNNFLLGLFLLASSPLYAGELKPVLVDFQDVAAIADPVPGSPVELPQPTQGPLLPPTSGFVFERLDGGAGMGYVMIDSNTPEFGVLPTLVWTNYGFFPPGNTDEYNPHGVTVSMQREDGAPFSLQSFFTAGFWFPAGAGDEPWDDAVYVKGYRADGTVLTKQISGPGVSDPDDTFPYFEAGMVNMNPGWNDLVQVTFGLDNGYRILSAVWTCVPKDSAKAEKDKNNAAPNGEKCK